VVKMNECCMSIKDFLIFNPIIKELFKPECFHIIQKSIFLNLQSINLNMLRMKGILSQICVS